jgi:pepF/M3 family oligoendopeptidase
MTDRPSAPLPHWSLDGIYPGLESPEFEAAISTLKDKIGALESFMQAESISRKGPIPTELTTIAERVEVYLDRANEIAFLYSTLRAYVSGIVSTDSFNNLAKRRLSELQLLGVPVETQEVRFRGWMGEAIRQAGNLETVLQAGEKLAEHAFYLRETFEQSRYLMSEPEEALTSELMLSGGAAWEKLQETVTSQVLVPFERNNVIEELPISALQNIVRYDPDERVRRAAFEAEIKAWEGVREPLAASLNGVKGTVNTLNHHRHREDSVHAALDQARIDRETLETMMGVMAESFPMFRKYYGAKAQRLGKEQLAWWDLFAPAGESRRSFPYPQARDFILEQFRTFGERLVALAARAFDDGWIDAEPRAGKVGGAFCMKVPLLEESRILANFDGSLDQLLTLAHELGHAFHNECLAGLTMLQRRTPMTLAETASTFCETLVTDAALRASSDSQEELAILETFLIGASQVIVDISSRFMFEKEVFERRRQAELSADDFCEIMTRCQKATYGDGLDEAHPHPYMWAWKPHYYSTGLSYYNFPYAFGLLFGLGLYAEFQKRGAAFVADYEGLLRSTGSGRAADLAGRFGIDLRVPEFWRGSLSVIEQRLERYLEI